MSASLTPEQEKHFANGRKVLAAVTTLNLDTGDSLCAMQQGLSLALAAMALSGNRAQAVGIANVLANEFKRLAGRFES